MGCAGDPSEILSVYPLAAQKFRDTVISSNFRFISKQWRSRNLPRKPKTERSSKKLKVKLPKNLGDLKKSFQEN